LNRTRSVEKKICFRFTRCINFRFRSSFDLSRIPLLTFWVRVEHGFCIDPFTAREVKVKGDMLLRGM